MMAAQLLSRRPEESVQAAGARLLRSGRWMGRMIEDMFWRDRNRAKPWMLEGEGDWLSPRIAGRTIESFGGSVPSAEGEWGLVRFDGVITSPPYPGRIDYHGQHRHAFELLQLDDRTATEIGNPLSSQNRRPPLMIRTSRWRNSFNCQ